MIGQPDTYDVIEAVARQLVRVEHGARRSIIQTPVVYPSGTLVGVRVVDEGGGAYAVNDMGSAYEEARSSRSTKAFGRHAGPVAEATGVGFDTRSFFLRGVPQDQLAGAVIAIANASQMAVTLVSHRQAALDAKDAEERLILRLERLFGKVEHHKSITGISGTEWNVDAVVRIGQKVVLFDAVSPYKQSIYATVAKYHDIGRLPEAPSRFAAVKSRESLGSMLGVLSQASTVVEEDTPDATILQFAKAA